MANVQQKVQDLIDNHAVAIFSKSYCPYCKKAKSTIKDLDLDDSQVGILELDEIDDGSAIQDYLEQKTNQRTVPSVWIRKEFIGGNSDLSKLSKAELQKRVQ